MKIMPLRIQLTLQGSQKGPEGMVLLVIKFLSPANMKDRFYSINHPPLNNRPP